LTCPLASPAVPPAEPSEGQDSASHLVLLFRLGRGGSEGQPQQQASVS
jgi:hypothetical protein